jgi:site-specific DNA-methyltransferase (adenine-specific)
MKTTATKSSRERKTKVLNFRIPPSVEAQLAHHLDPSRRITSPDKAARKVLVEALAEHEQRRRLETWNVDKVHPAEVFTGDAESVLAKLPPRICRTCICSPPYWRQRDYGHPDQIGQERVPARYVSRLANIFDEVYRVLTDDGTLWVVLDDSYRKKQLVGVPWRLAFELQRRGWFWRSEIVWAKASTPEAAKDRPTRAHEAVLLLAKRRAGYFYDYEAVLEPHDNPWAIDCIRKAQEQGWTGRPRNDPFKKEERRANGARGITRAEYGALMNPNGKNRRDVWQINTEKFGGSHSAVMPLRLAETCVKAASEPGDVVLDPFCGTGTTGVAALQNGRRFLGVELVPRFVETAHARLTACVANHTQGKTTPANDGNGHHGSPRRKECWPG